MQKSISITHKLYEAEESFNVPLFYEVLREDNTTTYKCKVALSPDRIPEWLTITEFNIPIVYAPGNPGVFITVFSEVRGIRNVDTAIFLAEAEQQISIAEQYNK